MSKSPLTQVREQFGSKKELATKLLPLLDRRDGATEKEFATRIQGASNKQLLRLSAVEEKVASTFGNVSSSSARRRTSTSRRRPSTSMHLTRA